MFLCRAYEEYQVETVYESVADLQFTHMAAALMADRKGDIICFRESCKSENLIIRKNCKKKSAPTTDLI